MAGGAEAKMEGTLVSAALSVAPGDEKVKERIAVQVALLIGEDDAGGPAVMVGGTVNGGVALFA